MKLLFNNKYGLLFALLGIIIQIIAFISSDVPWMSLVSGISGIFAVVLCAERRLSFWVFAWIQLITYVILAWNQKLWGEVGENVFYGITMIFGMFIWNKRTDNIETNKVHSRELSKLNFVLIMVMMIIAIGVLYFYLLKTNDSQPFIDSVSTVPAIIAQILMILAYKEQWYFWLIIDLSSIYMWAVVGDWCMVAQFIFWSINCIYGLKNWEK